jgi:hypothetical protein
MAAETAKIMRIPGFTYRGFRVPPLNLGAELIDNLGTGEPAYKLAPGSVPLADLVALYMVGMDLAIGEQLANGLPDSVKEAGRLIHEGYQARQGRGCWHKDGAILLPESEWPRGEVHPPGKHYAVYLTDIEGFEKKEGAWRPKPSSNTAEERIWLPPGGAFIVPSAYGGLAYDPKTGVPKETEKNRDKAISMWRDAGLTEEQADKELSGFYRRNSDVAAVYSWSFGCLGAVCVGLGSAPAYRSSSLGSFAASRAAERSEAPKNSGLK